MLVTESGIVIEVKLTQNWKAYWSMVVTVYPSTVEGIVIAPLKPAPLAVAAPATLGSPVIVA
jgi:hypothetical protein